MEKNNLEYLDKSKIMAYLKCPVLFKERYLDGKPFQTNIYIERGSQIHDFIKNFWDVMKINPHLNNFQIPNFFDNEVNSMAQNFLAFQYNRFKILMDKNRLDLFLPVYYEEKFTNEKQKIKGVVDIVTKELDGKLSLVEVKSGKNKELTPALELEIGFYDYLLCSLGIIVNYGVVYFPKTNDFIKFDLVHDYFGMKNIIENIRVNINNNTFEHKEHCGCDG